MKPWTNPWDNSVTIVSILRLTSLVKFANTQNITCKDMQHYHDLQTNHELRGLCSCGVLEYYWGSYQCHLRMSTGTAFSVSKETTSYHHAQWPNQWQHSNCPSAEEPRFRRPATFKGGNCAMREVLLIGFEEIRVIEVLCYRNSSIELFFIRLFIRTWCFLHKPIRAPSYPSPPPSFPLQGILRTTQNFGFATL